MKMEETSYQDSDDANENTFIAMDSDENQIIDISNQHRLSNEIHEKKDDYPVVPIIYSMPLGNDAATNYKIFSTYMQSILTMR